MSKSKLCPYRRHCLSAGTCESCDFEKVMANLHSRLQKQKAKNKLLQEENDRLREQINTLTNPNF